MLRGSVPVTMTQTIMFTALCLCTAISVSTTIAGIIAIMLIMYICIQENQS